MTAKTLHGVVTTLKYVVQKWRMTDHSEPGTWADEFECSDPLVATNYKYEVLGQNTEADRKKRAIVGAVFDTSGDYRIILRRSRVSETVVG